ncbi:hypothetical protein [Paraburkholderia aromaticivorans]|uniref:Uncharacterized protein n=1 Tax=Paraburkholderia aromaticivorans TaxID=2026199 RepID=A0A248VWX6_9BURK|nr:hypothetical protein [Paraburkholderia aromaticivorans]ASW03534.1 hypothetical protein CJU94_35890 [Paraburkholderia aromaticivorans]
MSEREQQINDALRALDDMHRQCRIERDDYRQRRRHLLDSLSGAARNNGHDTVRRAVPVNDLQPTQVTPARDGAGLREETAETRRVHPSAARRTACAFALGALALLACAAALRWFAMKA